MLGFEGLIPCMGKVNIRGRMEGTMKGSIRMTKSMDLGCIAEGMEGSIKGDGKMESSMERESMLWSMEILEEEFGMRGRG